MPDYGSFVPSAEWGWSQRTEVADPHSVRFDGTECGLFIGADCADG